MLKSLNALKNIKVPDKLQDQLKSMVATQGLIAALQMLCPIEISFTILANPIISNQKHDLALMFNLSNQALIQEPEDIESFITQILEERGSKAKIKAIKARYNKKESIAILIDRQ